MFSEKHHVSFELLNLLLSTMRLLIVTMAKMKKNFSLTEYNRELSTFKSFKNEITSFLDVPFSAIEDPS